MFAANSGLINDISASEVPEILGAYVALLKKQHPDLLDEISSSKMLPGRAEDVLRQTLQECLQTQKATEN